MSFPVFCLISRVHPGNPWLGNIGSGDFWRVFCLQREKNSSASGELSLFDEAHVLKIIFTLWCEN